MMDLAKDKETYIFQTPKGFERINIIFTPESIEWLSGTTKCKDKDGNVVSEIPNFSLYSDLLSRMALADSTADDFRRPQSVAFGQAQISELKLVEQWGLGRKKVRNILDKMSAFGLIALHKSRIATLVSFSGIDYVEMPD